MALDVTNARELDAWTRPDRAAALALVAQDSTSMNAAAEALTLQGWGRDVSYSRKVFIPLTHLCRDVCHYCTFAKAPRAVKAPFLTIEQCVDIAKQGRAAGCKEALFTLGDQPELRYAAAKTWLYDNGYASTLDYLFYAAKAVCEQTGLMPHLNPGVMTREDFERLRTVAVSMGIMLETASDRLSEKGMPHHGSPDKVPARRIETLKAAGEARVPMTTGLLIGIGETREERIDSLLAIRDLNEAHGHIQEIIIQNFKAKPDTRMADAPEPSLEEHLWTVAATRLIFGPTMSVQAPPNLQPDELAALIRAGVNDWGGVSPVTPDHVNPEAPWPHLDALAETTRKAGRHLIERLAIGSPYVRKADSWVDPGFVKPVLRAADSFGFARGESWSPGMNAEAPSMAALLRNSDGAPSSEIARLLERAVAGEELGEHDIVRMFAARGADLRAIIERADALRRDVCGETITFVINRNINYTNICTYRCTFCAFSKGGGARDARGPAYKLDFEEVARRAAEAWDKGATEVCLQGGIHPDYDGETYVSIVRAVKEATPDMHVHAFSPLEITHGAQTSNFNLVDYLTRLKDAGLSTLPGTAAEILDDEVRQIICADKLNTNEWLDVMEAAHSVGLRSTATIMFGHVDRVEHWARHILRVRRLQARTGGFTEFVPLPFVHMEAPMWRKGKARSGPTYRESVLMHSIARLALHTQIDNIQTSWVKMGPDGAAVCLQAGANDLGGVLMNESITRAAGGQNGQLLDEAAMRRIAADLGRPARQRNTVYGEPPARPREEIAAAQANAAE